MCSVQSFFQTNHTLLWTFQEQTPSRFLENIVGKIPMPSNMEISKSACKKRRGVAYDRHGNTLIRATRLEKQGLLRHRQASQPEPKRARPKTCPRSRFDKLIQSPFRDIPAGQKQGHLRA
jgi:hypothetical protein